MKQQCPDCKTLL
uniref:Uncharacterized protein n=1 Tax=Anguilla anguilla TaxID=7936 RepID=A0A0E9RDI8_ANGAN